MAEDYQPILLLPTRLQEYGRKGGGGETKPPLVEVTTQFRGNLETQLAASANILERLSLEQRQNGIPLAVKLRERALAKSNRPFKLLEGTGSTPVAAGHVGELIARATEHSLAQLSDAIRTRSSKEDLFQISTLESIRVWDPVLDAFGVSDLAAADAVLDRARATNTPLRIDLFPWVRIDSPVTASETIAQYLQTKGYTLVGVIGSDSWTSAYFDLSTAASARDLGSVFGIRSASIAPTYSAYSESIEAQSFREIGSIGASDVTFRGGIGAEVGLLDSGVNSTILSPWITATERYDTGHALDTRHGTFVAGLLVASRELNDGDSAFPDDTVNLVDAQVLPNGSIEEYVLVERITEVLAKRAPSGPKVWNCSFASLSPMDPVGYSTLAQEMDRLAAKYGLLFVQAVGNYVESPVRKWPPTQALRDGLASPSEAISSLSVGSLSHRGGLTPIGCPASYSRRGPSFGGQQKPDVTYWSGDLDAELALGGYGICSVVPGDLKAESIGTSFATPIVSSIAANTWKELQDAGALATVRPELVKGLLVHAASVQGQDMADADRSYHGAGVPVGGLRALFDSPNTFTTVHEVDLPAHVDWRKDPFPVPQCLFDDGKLSADMTMTIAYAPVIDAAFGDEAVRTCVEGSLGEVVDIGGRPHLKGKVPLESGTGTRSWESERITQGKWSPIKTYKKAYTRGTKCGTHWALKLSMTVRDTSLDDVTQKAFVVVTFRGLREGMQVYQDGIRALNALQYQTRALSNVAHLRVGL